MSWEVIIELYKIFHKELSKQDIKMIIKNKQRHKILKKLDKHFWNNIKQTTNGKENSVLFPTVKTVEPKPQKMENVALNLIHQKIKKDKINHSYREQEASYAVISMQKERVNKNLIWSILDLYKNINIVNQQIDYLNRNMYNLFYSFLFSGKLFHF